MGGMLEAGFDMRDSEPDLRHFDYSTLRAAYNHYVPPHEKFYGPPLVEMRWHATNGHAAKWCVPCQKWMDQSHLIKTTHVEWLQYYTDTAEGWARWSRDFMSRATNGATKPFTSHPRLVGR